MPLTVRDCVIKLPNNRPLCTTFPFVTPGCVSHFCTLHRFSPFHCAVFVLFRVPLRKLQLPNARGKVECQERLTGGRFFHPGARLSRDVRYRGQQSAVTLRIDHTKNCLQGHCPRRGVFVSCMIVTLVIQKLLADMCEAYLCVKETRFEYV